MSEQRIVIIGGSHAGLSCAEKLRHFGCESAIDVIDALSGWPIQRPPLSKAYLAEQDETGQDRFLLRQPEWFEQFNITFHEGVSITEILPDEKRVITAEGHSLTYSKLIIATGATPRLLAPAYHQLDGVCVLRHKGDADQLKEIVQSRNIRSAVIIGGGYIGLETAASLTKFGIKTTIIEMADRVLARVASEELSVYCAALHQENGVEIVTGAAVQSLSGTEGKLEQIELSDGRVFAAELALVGIGVIPDMALAQQAGLTTGNGIHVSENYQTSHPDIYAIGDVAFADAHAAIRVESVHHAQFSAMIAAADITAAEAGRAEAWWFWSDQYDVKFQMAGLVPAPGEHIHTVTRSGRKPGSLSVWSFCDDRLVSVEAANDAQAYMVGKTCLEKKLPVTAEWLEDTSNEIKTLLRS